MRKEINNFKVAEILHYYFATGQSLENIAKRYRINKQTISNIITRFIHTFREEQPLINPTMHEKSEEEMLLNKEKLSDQRFYDYTQLDPNNRWWVGKGKMS